MAKKQMTEYKDPYLEGEKDLMISGDRVHH